MSECERCHARRPAVAKVIELRVPGDNSSLERVFLTWLREAMRGNPGFKGGG